MAHDLIWIENRRTPKVVSEGDKYEPKESEGKIVKRRKATAEEEKTIANGDWVRVNKADEKPSDSGYKDKKSKVRPNLSLTAAAEDENEYDGVTHAGLAVVAADTGRVLLAQRAMDETDDPDVQETWEFPGGGLDEGESPQAGAMREFGEEVGADITDHEVVGGWRAPDEDGNYQGYILIVPSEWPNDDFQPNDEVQALHWANRNDIGIGTRSKILRPEMENTPWDEIFGAVSRNEDDMDDEMLDEPEWDPLMATVEPIPVHGIVAPEEVPTGDRRMFAKGSMTSRPLRLPFSHVKADIGEHQGSVVTGSVDRMMRKDGMVHWEGLLMPTPETDELVGMMVFFGGRTGVSVDGDNGSLDKERSNAEDMAVFDAVRASGLTAVAIPAYHEAYGAFGWHATMPSPEDALTASMIDEGDMVGGRVTFDRGAGWVTNPGDTKRIHDYWVKKGQPGYTKIGWGTRGDFTRAKALIGEKIAKNSPDKMKYLNQIIAQWHFDALGYWPGDLDKPGNKTTAEARAERRNVAASIEEVLADVDGLEAVVVNAAGEEVESEWEAVLVSSAAGADRKRPPAHYFDRHPETGNLTIEDPDEFGFRRVHGYAAEWGVCHIGFQGQCVEPPRTFSDEYPEFHLGRTRVDFGNGEQSFIKTGVLTYNVGHRDAKTILSESATQAHFDNLRNAWSAVCLGEDDRGIWFSGVLLPKIDEDDIDKIHASGQVSGEWKGGRLRACLAVNTPGFPVLQASAVYGADGEVLALSASSFSNTLTASINGVADSPCAPTPAERLAALREVDAEIRFAALRDEFIKTELLKMGGQ